MSQVSKMLFKIQDIGSMSISILGSVMFIIIVFEKQDI